MEVPFSRPNASTSASSQPITFGRLLTATNVPSFEEGPFASIIGPTVTRYDPSEYFRRPLLCAISIDGGKADLLLGPKPHGGRPPRGIKPASLTSYLLEHMRARAVIEFVAAQPHVHVSFYGLPVNTSTEDQGHTVQFEFRNIDGAIKAVKKRIFADTATTEYGGSELIVEIDLLEGKISSPLKLRDLIRVRGAYSDKEPLRHIQNLIVYDGDCFLTIDRSRRSSLDPIILRRIAEQDAFLGVANLNGRLGFGNTDIKLQAKVANEKPVFFRLGADLKIAEARVFVVGDLPELFASSPHLRILFSDGGRKAEAISDNLSLEELVRLYCESCEGKARVGGSPASIEFIVEDMSYIVPIVESPPLHITEVLSRELHALERVDISFDPTKIKILSCLGYQEPSGSTMGLQAEYTVFRYVRVDGKPQELVGIEEFDTRYKDRAAVRREKLLDGSWRIGTDLSIDDFCELLARTYQGKPDAKHASILLPDRKIEFWVVTHSKSNLYKILCQLLRGLEHVTIVYPDLSQWKFSIGLDTTRHHGVKYSNLVARNEMACCFAEVTTCFGIVKEVRIFDRNTKAKICERIEAPAVGDSPQVPLPLCLVPERFSLSGRRASNSFAPIVTALLQDPAAFKFNPRQPSTFARVFLATAAPVHTYITDADRVRLELSRLTANQVGWDKIMTDYHDALPTFVSYLLNRVVWLEVLRHADSGRLKWPKNCLSVGGGTGDLFLALDAIRQANLLGTRAMPRAHLIDFSPNAIRLAPDWVTSRCEDYYDSPDTESWEMIECSSLQRFGRHQRVLEAVEKMSRSLKPGGILALQTQGRLLAPEARELLRGLGLAEVIPTNSRLDFDRQFLRRISPELRSKIVLTCRASSLAIFEKVASTFEEPDRAIDLRLFERPGSTYWAKILKSVVDEIKKAPDERVIELGFQIAEMCRELSAERLLSYAGVLAFCERYLSKLLIRSDFPASAGLMERTSALLKLAQMVKEYCQDDPSGVVYRFAEAAEAICLSVEME